MPLSPRSKEIQGVIPPLATPLTGGELDLPAIDRLVEHVLAGGVDGLFLLGTTGEGPSLTAQQQLHYVERVCEANRGRVQILCAVSNPSLSEAIELSGQAHGAGADAVVSAGPYYLPISQDQLAAYCETLADEIDLPLVLYNMPGCTKNVFELDTVERLERHPNIVGMKDSSGDMDYFRALVDQYGNSNFSVLIGPEEKLGDAVLYGGDGGVCGGGNLFPQLYAQIYSAARDGDRERLADLQAVVEELFETVYFVGEHHPTRIMQGVKAALFALGICSPETAAPIAPLTGEQLAQVVDATTILAQRLEVVCPR